MMWFVLAAALGAVLRFLADALLPHRGILLVNVVGSFVAGLTLGLYEVLTLSAQLVQIVLGGFAGSLTTYATVALVTAEQRMQRTGSPIRTWVEHVGLSAIACGCAWFGTILLWR